MTWCAAGAFDILRLRRLLVSGSRPLSSAVSRLGIDSVVELIAEILLAVVQFICELLLQIFGNLVAELGWYSVREALRPSQPPRRIVGLVGFTIMGGTLGAASLLIFRNHFAIGIGLRLATLVMGPVISAIATLLLAGLFQRYLGALEFRWRFGNAFAFSLTFALVRFAYAH